MSFLMIVLFIFLAFVFAVFRKRKCVLATLSLSLILIFVIGSGLLPDLALQSLQTQNYNLEPQWKDQNAIVVLGGGTTQLAKTNQVFNSPLSSSRVQETARLYFRCKKQSPNCLIITSGGNTMGHNLPEAEVIARDLKDLGVAAEDIIPENRSLNTFQNAQFSSEIYKGRNVNRLVLVTSGLHMRRALVYFSFFGTTPIGAPSDYWQIHLSIWPQAYHFAVMDMILHEYLGLIRFQFYNLMGWNKSKTT